MRLMLPDRQKTPHEGAGYTRGAKQRKGLEGDLYLRTELYDTEGFRAGESPMAWYLSTEASTPMCAETQLMKNGGTLGLHSLQSEEGLRRVHPAKARPPGPSCPCRAFGGPVLGPAPDHPFDLLYQRIDHISFGHLSYDLAT